MKYNKFFMFYKECSSIFTFWEMFLGIQDTQDTSFLRLWKDDKTKAWLRGDVVVFLT